MFLQLYSDHIYFQQNSKQNKNNILTLDFMWKVKKVKIILQT